MMVDTHAHAHFNAYKGDMDEVIKRSLAKGVIMNLVGTQRDTSKKGVAVAEKYDGCYASVGLHPEHLFSKHVDEEETPFRSREEHFDYEYYRTLAQNSKVIGIGECGLDLYRIPEGLTASEMLPRQTEVFKAHIKLAQDLQLPLVIHCREAHAELIDILSSDVIPTEFTRVEESSRSSIDSSAPSRSALNNKEQKMSTHNDNIKKQNTLRGTIHCYTSNWQNAQKYLALGFYLGFTGVITFPPQKANPGAQADLLEVVAKIPLDRILLETDCPYLSPLPYRGKRGEPWMVEATAQKIAEIRGLGLDQILEITTANALRLFTKIGGYTSS